MISSLKKILLIAMSVIACSFTLFGYASVTDNMLVTGSAEISPPDYDEVVITQITAVSSTTEYVDSYCVSPSTIKSTITGDVGQKVVYKIKAHNYSEDKTFIYTGTAYDTTIFEDLTKLEISVSQDEQNLNPINENVGENYHQGTPIAPGEDFVFYITYTLTENVSVGEIMVNYSFKQVIYSITYLNKNQTWIIDYITNNNVAYSVRTEAPEQPNLKFEGWVNANAVIVTSIPAGNTNSYSLSPSWESVYLIIFADANGNILYEEQITKSTTQLSAQGQATVDRILAELNAEAQKEHMKVTWSEYSFSNIKQDITVKAIYSYDGILNLVPVYEKDANGLDDGIVDYYSVKAVDTLPETVIVPGEVGGVPVKVVDRIANTEGDNDWNNYAESVKTIVIGEGVERLEHNSLAYTPNLATVKLPSTINYLGPNTFSRNDLFGNDRKQLTIEFNGTKAEWKAILANSDGNWHKGLKKGTKVICSDGYFEVTKFSSLTGVPTWQEY